MPKLSVNRISSGVLHRHTCIALRATLWVVVLTTLLGLFEPLCGLPDLSARQSG